MKYREVTAGIGAVALVVGATFANADSPPPMTDAAFVQAAQLGNDEEIADARYVLGLTKNPEIRRFATEMVSDHSAANVELLKEARNAHVPVPQMMRREKASAAPAALAGMVGMSLDTTYITTEIAGHKKMLAMVKAEETKAGADPALVRYATDQDPVVQKHLDQIGNIQSTGAMSAASTAPNLRDAQSTAAASSAPSPISTQQTNGGVPTAVPMASGSPIAAPPTHAP